MQFELEPLLADLSSNHGDKHARRRLIRAYGAAWARLQTQQPGFARTPAEQAFVDELVSWLVLHEAMLIDEIIPHLYQYLHANPGAPERAEYSHTLIDEYQDLNRAEQDVLGYLGAQGAICIIGDDDQSIYSFKHAHPEGIRQWHTLHVTDDHSIQECRRCPTTVVRMANALIARNADRIQGRAMLERAANGAGEVVIRQYASADAEATAVASKITQLIQSGVHPREIVVLAQRATFAGPIFERLRAQGIPTKSYYAETELDSMEAQERFALLKLMLNNEDRVALRWLLGRGHASWRASQYARLMQRMHQDGTSPWATLTRMADGQITISHTVQLVDRFRVIRDEIAALGAAADLDQFIQLLRDRYRMRPAKALTRTAIWDMERKKAWDPATYIPYVVSEGGAWGRERLTDGERFSRASVQKGWIAQGEGRVLEDVYLSDATQSIFFLGRERMRGPGGEELVESDFQPIFHVAHGVGGTEDEPLNLWSIVIETPAEDRRYHAPFEEMVAAGWLPGFIEIYIARDLGVELTRV